MPTARHTRRRSMTSPSRLTCHARWQPNFKCWVMGEGGRSLNIFRRKTIELLVTPPRFKYGRPGGGGYPMWNTDFEHHMTPYFSNVGQPFPPLNFQMSCDPGSLYIWGGRRVVEGWQVPVLQARTTIHSLRCLSSRMPGISEAGDDQLPFIWTMLCACIWALFSCKKIGPWAPGWFEQIPLAFLLSQQKSQNCFSKTKYSWYIPKLFWPN